MPDSTQLLNFISWKGDIKAISSNVFQMFWGKTKAFILPPCRLITNLLAKVEQDQTHSIMLTVPFWKTQPCYPQLLKLLAATFLQKS